ncbi:MAG: hypothetical protein PVJ57_01335 [Phycisphaerae bacterium]
MGVDEIRVDALPAGRREVFAEFARTVQQMAGDGLLGLCACGGWVVDDRFYERAPAQGVLVLREVDLNLLDRLASVGGRFGRRNVAAPLIMTSEYIEASRDVFPLELLEIQQLHRVVCGADHFESLSLAPADLRLQCERELKSELIRMRQGLIAAAGKRGPLDELCAGAAERSVRVLRGILHLVGREVPALVLNVMETAAEVAGLRLVTLARAAAGADHLDFDGFRRCYDEVAALAHYVDQLTPSGAVGA